MSESTDEHRFRVEQRDDFGDRTGDIGVVSCDAGGMLRVVEATPAFASVLSDIVQAVNDAKVLRTKVPPSPQSEPNSVAWRDVERSDPDLAFMLGEYVEQKYGLFLVPVDAVASLPGRTG